MLGICNGFQILTEAGLLPGALRPNASLSFVCRDVPLGSRAPTRRSPRAATPGRRSRSRSSTATAAGSPTPSCSPSSSASGQIVLRYGTGANPNGSVGDVAGVTNAERKRVRAHAAPGARGRSAARLDRRRAAPRLAGRCGSVVGCARSSRPLRRERRQSRRLLEGGAEPVEIARAQRHRAAPHDAVGRVRDAHEALAAIGLEQLDDRAEPPFAGPLRERHPLDERRCTEGSRRLCHASTVAMQLQQV